MYLNVIISLCLDHFQFFAVVKSSTVNILYVFCVHRQHNELLMAFYREAEKNDQVFSISLICHVICLVF